MRSGSQFGDDQIMDEFQADQRTFSDDEAQNMHCGDYPSDEMRYDRLQTD